jgi:hypothetical protein
MSTRGLFAVLSYLPVPNQDHDLLVELREPHPEFFPVPFLFIQNMFQDADHFRIVDELNMLLVALNRFGLQLDLPLQLTSQIVTAELELTMFHRRLPASFHDQIRQPPHVPHLVNRDALGYPAGITRLDDERVSDINHRILYLTRKILIQEPDDLLNVRDFFHAAKYPVPAFNGCDAAAGREAAPASVLYP